MKPCQHVLYAIMRKLAEGRFERCLITAQYRPAFGRELDSQFLCNFRNDRFIRAGRDDSGGNQLAQFNEWAGSAMLAPGCVVSISTFSIQVLPTTEARSSASVLRRSASRRICHASGVAPLMESRVTRCAEIASSRAFSKAVVIATATLRQSPMPSTSTATRSNWATLVKRCSR